VADTPLANVAIPLVLDVGILMALAFVPVVAVESLVAWRVLRGPFRRVAAAVLVANVVSTAVGVLFAGLLEAGSAAVRVPTSLRGERLPWVNVLHFLVTFPASVVLESLALAWRLSPEPRRDAAHRRRRHAERPGAAVPPPARMPRRRLLATSALANVVSYGALLAWLLAMSRR
jgi:hypothetical protein